MLAYKQYGNRRKPMQLPRAFVGTSCSGREQMGDTAEVAFGGGCRYVASLFS